MTDGPQLPKGFRYAGVRAGIKESGDLDLALLAAESGAGLTAAGVYTENLVRASSIDWNRQITPHENAAAVVINAGNANACTGRQGTADNEKMARQVALQLGVAANQVLVLSTGVIGVPLPMSQVAAGIDLAAANLTSEVEAFGAMSRAILTTDTGPKTSVRLCALPAGRHYRLAGICKGAGMIGPRLATLLGVMLTDLALTPTQAQSAIERAVEQSFNRISVDGHTSTNDAILLLSSGKKSGPANQEEFDAFVNELTTICIELAKMIPADGEGASHLITIEVSGAKDDANAERIARCIGASNLVKTAITGADPNWGRIVSAAGYSGAELSVADTCLELNGFLVFESGNPVAFDEAVVSDSLNTSHEILIRLQVGDGPGVARHWTSDLTYEYVRINSEYRT